MILGHKPLGRMKTYVKRKIEEKELPIVSAYGASLASDGASAVDRTPFLNLLKLSAGLVHFIETKDCRGHIKDAKYIADFVIDYIMSLKTPTSIRQVLMDNACRSSWPLIEAACPWIVCAPCVPHCGNLELHDMKKKLLWYDSTIDDVRKIKNFVNLHQAVWAEFMKHSARALSTPGDTRMGTHVIGTEAVLVNKAALRSTILSDAVAEYVRRNRSMRPTLRSGKKGRTLFERYLEVKELIVGDAFWPKAKGVCDVSSPVMSVIRVGDQDGPTASKIHYLMYMAQEKMKKVDLSFLGRDQKVQDETRDTLISIHHARWDYLFSDIIAAGYLLDPEYWDIPDKHEDPEINQGFLNMVRRTFPDPAHPEPSASQAQRSRYGADKAEMMEKRATAELQLSHYMSKSGTFAREETQHNAQRMAACEWWNNYGIEVPELRKVAMYVLAQPCGAGSSERGHKEMNFVKSKVRNRLGSQKTSDMVYVRFNIHQVEKIETRDYNTPCPKWNEDDCDSGDEVDVCPEAVHIDPAEGGSSLLDEEGGEPDEDEDDISVASGETDDDDDDGDNDAWRAARLAEEASFFAKLKEHEEKGQRKSRGIKEPEKRIEPLFLETDRHGNALAAVDPRTITSSRRTVRRPVPADM